MKIKLLQCGICEHWHMPSAHHNHCPACGTFVLVVLGRRMYYNVVTARETIRSGWPLSLKRLVATAGVGSE